MTFAKRKREERFDVLERQVGRFENSEEGWSVVCKAMERIVARGKACGKRSVVIG